LVRQGHDLTLGASGDSITQATLVRARTLASRRECRAKTWEQRSLPCLVQIYDRWLTQLEPHIFGHMNMVSASPPTHEFLLSFGPRVDLRRPFGRSPDACLLGEEKLQAIILSQLSIYFSLTIYLILAHHLSTRTSRIRPTLSSRRISFRKLSKLQNASLSREPVMGLAIIEQSL
jgi:hypothetical protein